MLVKISKTIKPIVLDFKFGSLLPLNCYRLYKYPLNSQNSGVNPWGVYGLKKRKGAKLFAVWKSPLLYQEVYELQPFPIPRKLVIVFICTTGSFWDCVFYDYYENFVSFLIPLVSVLWSFFHFYYATWKPDYFVLVRNFGHLL